MVDNSELAGIVERFLRMEHLRALRIHTRAPVVEPDRVDAELVGILRRCSESRTVVVVIHANHAQELQGDCSAALGRLREAGLTLLHQGVLLRQVNDSAHALEALMTALLDHGVLPYYLHQLDRVQGAAHFDVDEDTGRALMRELRRRLPGYAVPRYVREEAGAASKTPL